MSQKALNICGGGLWGGLLAYRLQSRKPEVPFVIYEKSKFFGGNHTWCFHESDLTPAQFQWLKPFIVKSWNQYEVKFPQYQRTINGRYHAITSERFHEVLLDTLPPERYRLSASCHHEIFLDARGSSDLGSRVGYQKFFGILFKLKEQHYLKSPIIIDSTVPQIDGFHFLYYLPFSSDEVLVESTYYSNDPELKKIEIENFILNEIQRKGWQPELILRKEEGILPLPLEDYVLSRELNPSLAGILHDTTGFSLPDAVRVVDAITDIKDISLGTIRNQIEIYKHSRKPYRKYYQFLNRMMFQAPPLERYKVLQHFYRLPEELIQRFYRGETSHTDKLRILLGKPPIQISTALRALKPRSFV